MLGIEGKSIVLGPPFQMPKSLNTPKQFLEMAKTQGAKWIKIKRLGGETMKFKLRCPRYLYTLTIKTKKLSDLIIDSIPAGLEVIQLSKN